MGCAQLWMVLKFLEILPCLLLQNSHNVIKVISFLLKSNTVKNEVDQTFSPKCDNLFKSPPNSGHLSITDKFFKTPRRPLFRGFSVVWVE